MDETVAAAGGQDSKASFRLAAAALAGLPVGFAAGALLGGRLLTTPTTPDAGPTLLALGVFGALFGAGIMAFAAMQLTAKAARRATLLVGAVSAVVVLYMVYDFIVDRMARARAFDAAYAKVPTFELALTASDEDRRPFSDLAYRSETRTYSARRPGGWLCQGAGTRAHDMALFHAIRDADPALTEDCERRVAWRIADGAKAEGCASASADALFSAADTMIEATERRSSCRRAE